MTLRLRILQMATACLYIGPLLAGMGGYGWAVVPVFIAIFLLWLIVLRPQEWPQTAADWQSPDSWLAIATRAVVQTLLVVICFGVGRGLAGVAGLSVTLPFMGPIFLSLLAIPIARLACPPGQSAAINAFLDDALTEVEAAATPDAEAGRRAAARLFAARLTEPLTELRPDTEASVIEGHLAALRGHLEPEVLLEALHDRLADAGPALRRAFILQATDPLTVEACQGRAAPVQAMQVAGDDPALLELFAERCALLLDQNADAWGDCPNETALDAARARFPEQSGVGAALRALIQRNRALAPLA